MAAGDGLVTMTPTSIVVAGAGSSASIQSDGSVDFSAATSLSLNGVFTSAHDNYVVVIRSVSAANTVNLNARLRAAGTDASGSNYARQYFSGDGTAIGAARSTSQTSAPFSNTDATNRSGSTTHVYGPALAQPTAWRLVSANGFTSAYIQDEAATHSLSTSYDGITLITSSSSVTGNIVVFGYEE